jgi:beta-galactosidase
MSSLPQFIVLLTFILNKVSQSMKHFTKRVAQLIYILGIILMVPRALAIDTPRAKTLMDFNWKFHLGDAPDAGTNLDYPEVKDLAKTRLDEIGQEGELANIADAAANNLGADISFVQNNFDDSNWRKLDLPHDWVVELPFDEKADAMHGFKPIGTNFLQNSIGWYRKEFDLPASDKEKVLWLEFDGAYRNSLVWLNGHCLGRHLSGYSSFRYDISQFANYGGENVLVVRVDASRFEGWFYEGAGIYRHVWLEKTSPIAIAPDGIFIYSKFKNNVPDGDAEMNIQTRFLSLPETIRYAKLVHEIIDPDGKVIISRGNKLYQNATLLSETKFHISSPKLWSPENPNLYKLITTVLVDDKIVDRKETEFGIRTIAFDPTNGFLLNGKPYFLKGTCEHQDHAGAGTAIPDALQYFRVKKLKEMGSNTIRTSHNPPTPEFLEACDRLGMLVMDENRRMDDSNYESNELKSLILRDRDHPSVFMWSLGNEETELQGSKAKGDEAARAHEASIKIATAMQNVAHEVDPTRLCTVAMNGGIGEGFSKVIDVQGWNYTWAGDPDKYHAAHSNTPQIGTETASTRSTRGIYENDKARGYLSAYDVNTTHYLLVNGVKSNLTAEGWWNFYSARPFLSGVFNWTGFDYRGEPVPYKWPVINSLFGCIDMCGFPKDVFYYYQSVWTDKPMVHLLPHWNWPAKEGQSIEVWCYSNCKEVELFLNGKSLGKEMMEPNGHLQWQVNYTPGTLSAKGFDANGTLIAETKVETTGAPAAIQLSSDRTTINADGEDCSIVNVSVVDAQGRVVPTADNLVHFELSGPGKIIGVGNGDPSCHEPDKREGNWQRSAFNGWAQIIVQSTQKPGEIQLLATSTGLRAASQEFDSK